MNNKNRERNRQDRALKLLMYINERYMELSTKTMTFNTDELATIFHNSAHNILMLFSYLKKNKLLLSVDEKKIDGTWFVTIKIA